MTTDDHASMPMSGGIKYSEVSASGLLLNYRREHPTFRGASFKTIAAFGSNGAVIHYTPSDQTDKMISNSSLFLGKNGEERA